MVETTLSYLSPISQRPHYYLYDPPPGTPSRNTKGDRRPVAIHDGRELGSQLSLDEAGFLLANHATAVENLYDANAVRERYYPEIETLVQRLTGAALVRAFDHNVRSSQKAERADAARLALEPVRLAHNDYTERSGPQRVRDLMGGEAEARLARRARASRSARWRSSEPSAMRTAVLGHIEWVDFVRVERLPRSGEILRALEAWEEPAGGGGVSAGQLAELAGACTLYTALGN